MTHDRLRPQLPAVADVVVIGAGVIGASIAYHLAEAGVRVVVLERGQAGRGSSGKPIGGVRAQFSDPLNIRMGLRSMEAYRDFAVRPGTDIGLESVGYLFVLGHPDEVAGFETSVAVQNALGVPSRIITPGEARELCPYLAPDGFVAAAYSASDGYARPPAVVAGYLRAARRHGVIVREHCAVTGIECAGGAVRTVHTPDGTVRASAVVCAAGAWSARVGAMAGVDLPVIPVKRQIAWTAPVDPRPPRIPFTLDFGSTAYFHNSGHDGLLFGMSDARQEPGFDTRFTRDWLEPFRTVMRRRAPMLADMRVVDGWAGLYEVTPDYNALIGKADHVGGFLYATGFSGHGFLQAPAVGEIVRDLYLGSAPFIDTAPLAATRFDDLLARPEANII